MMTGKHSFRLIVANVRLYIDPYRIEKLGFRVISLATGGFEHHLPHHKDKPTSLSNLVLING